MPLKTLFLNPPSFENFDGGAGSRWPATREIESYWYPVWLAYPAGMLEGARLLDAPPHHVSGAETIEIAKEYEFLVLFTSTPGFPGDILLSRAIKQANPKIKIAFVGPHVSVLPEKSLRDCPEIDFICRKEFDYAIVDYAKGKPLADIPGVSFLKDGTVVHNPDAPQIQDLDALPHVTEVYKRDLDVTKYNVPFLLNPYVSLYTTRGCPAQCTFCLWPQTLSGHPWRKRSSDDVAAEMAKAKQLWPEVKEFFFDDDTFNIQKARTIELCTKLKSSAMNLATSRFLKISRKARPSNAPASSLKTATSSAWSSTATSSWACRARRTRPSTIPSRSPRNSTSKPFRFRWRMPIPAPSCTTMR